MAISKVAGTKLFISPVSVNPDTFKNITDSAAIALFEAISDWVEVEEIEDFGEHGDTAAKITFESVADSRTRKLKGTRDAGTKTIVVGVDPLDDGQVALAAAQATDFNYAFKVVRSDARAANYTNTVEYFIGLVSGEAVNQGSVNNVVKQTFPIDLNTKIYRKLSALVPAPTVASLDVITGSAAGGTDVEITGTNFVNVLSVKFGGASATNVVVVDATTLTCKTPAHAAGAVTVDVTTGSGTGSKAAAFTYS